METPFLNLLLHLPITIKLQITVIILFDLIRTLLFLLFSSRDGFLFLLVAPPC